MKLLIKKTSEEYGYMPPCKNAIKGAEIFTDMFEWYVEINSIEDLTQLTEEVKEEIIIIPPNKSLTRIFELEIYDCFRE